MEWTYYPQDGYGEYCCEYGHADYQRGVAEDDYSPLRECSVYWNLNIMYLIMTGIKS